MSSGHALRLRKWSKVRSFLRASLPAAIALTTAPLAAAPITWIGGNADWTASNANWNPADEPDADDEAIFNTPNTVDMVLATNEIEALTLSGGIDLNTNNNDLTVDGLVSLTGASTNLLIGGSTSLLTADDVTVGNGSGLRMQGGTLRVIEETGSGLLNVLNGGAIAGNGRIELNDAAAAGTVLLQLTGGDLTATSTVPDLFGAAAATLTIDLADSDARVDLDAAGSIVSVSRNDTLAIIGVSHGAADPYSGTMNLGDGSTFNSSTAFQTNSATINVNTGGIIVGEPGAAATIIAPSWTMTGGTIDLDAIDSLRISAPFTATGGNIDNAGLVIFNANSTIGPAANFNMTGIDASITVNPGVTVNIDDPNFDADASALTGNLITIGDNAVLDLDLGAGADESLGGRLNLNGGELSVTTADGNWVFDGVATIGSSTFAAQILGDDVTFTNGSVNVLSGGSLLVIADSTWTAGLNLATNGTTRLAGTTTFNNAGSFTGLGSLRTAGDTFFVTPTTFNMPSGNVDLDGGDLVGNTVTVNANTTINVETMSSFGVNTIAGGPDTLVLNNFASLIVNITDPNAEWTLNSVAVLDINAVGGMLGGSGIQGSDFNMAGTASISGNSIWTARTDISGTATVAAAGSLNLRGGDLTAANVNRLVGGTITGAGVLRALADEGLFGFGTINTDVEFDTNTELRADNGTLNVNGPIVEVGVIGTADNDGILNVALVWNTNIAGLVEMDGGEIRGATITNDDASGINGHGLLSARVINNTRIDAEGGGTLIVNSPLNTNDWDGATNNGQLNALTANLEIVDNAAFTFQGDIRVNNTREMFVNGFQMDLDDTSLLNLQGGTYRTTNSVRIGGDVQVGTAPSTLSVNATALFQSTSNTVLNNDLRLNPTTTTSIEAGATFSGGGALVNLPGKLLALADSANVAVLVENEGIISINSGLAGQADVNDFQQALSGTYNVDLGGTGLNDIDRLDVNGAAQLAGTLDIDLFAGYTPAVTDPLMTILAATGGRTGTFTLVNQPAVMPAGLLFDVIYTPTLVRLQVINGVDTWDNSTGNAQWSDALNWGDDTEPTGQVVATFPAGFPNGDTVITLSAGETARSLAFLDSYSLTGGSLTLGPAASISVDATKSATISSILNLSGSLTKTGDGSLTVNHVRATSLLVNAGTLAIASNGASAGTSVVDSLATAGNSGLNLNDNDLIVHATALTKDAVHAAVQADIVTAQNGVDAALITNWDGPGVTSSFARTANLGTGFDLVGLGVIRNSDLDITTGLPGSSYASFSGQPVTPDDVLVKYTYIGDANLSGAVSFDDYVGIDNAFFGLIPNLGWATGDINFDGVINFDDYSKVDQAFFFQGAPLSADGTGVSAVPEPGTWLLAAFASLASLVTWFRPEGSSRASCGTLINK